MDAPVPRTVDEVALAAAVRVFGDSAGAELWMTRPCVGLDNRRPVDLLGDTEGRQTVLDFIGRLEYNVYT